MERRLLLLVTGKIESRRQRQQNQSNTNSRCFLTFYFLSICGLKKLTVFIKMSWTAMTMMYVNLSKKQMAANSKQKIKSRHKRWPPKTLWQQKGVTLGLKFTPSGGWDGRNWGCNGSKVSRPGFWLWLCAKICNFVMKYAHVQRAARTIWRRLPTTSTSSDGNKINLKSNIHK